LQTGCSHDGCTEKKVILQALQPLPVLLLLLPLLQLY
jgi:hypothetical protein